MDPLLVPTIVVEMDVVLYHLGRGGGFGQQDERLPDLSLIASGQRTGIVHATDGND